MLNMARPRQALMKTLILLLLAVAGTQPRCAAAQDFTDVAVDKPPTAPSDTSGDDAQQAALKQAERLTVVAPKFLRPQSDYHVLIQLANSQVPASIDLQLTGARDSNREQTEAKSVLVASGETQTVKFSVGDWPPAEYILGVTAQAVDRSWNFTQETGLTYQAKSYSAFIQTDKAIYKPGQQVQFRALFVQPNGLSPLALKEEIDVSVLDAKRNLIKQWRALSNWRGLVSLSFQLSEEPVLGDWTIKVEARKQEISKQFRVAEYILPTFEVQLQLPPYATYNQSDVVATVRASYTYGKPVNGHVALTVQPLVRFSYIATRPLEQAQFRARLVNGSADISVDVVRDLRLQRGGDLFEREIEFFALVEEDLTGRKYNSTQVMKVHESPIKVELVNKEEHFKPGLVHPIQLKVAYQDDTPVEDSGPELVLRPSFMGAQLASSRLSEARLRPVGGLVEHQLDVPRRLPAPGQPERLVAPWQIDLVAIYRGHRHYLPSIKAFSSQSEQYMQVSLPALNQPRAGKKLKQPQRSVSVEEQLRVRVVATEPMGLVTCQGLARGDIVWAINRDLMKNATEFEFEVRVEQKMAPETLVVCFYIRPENKELITDSKRVIVQGLTKNFARISTSLTEAKPGQKVQVSVLTTPNSLVGLLGIDQSVLLLRQGHDISQEDLARELNSYGSSPSADSEGPPEETVNAHALLEQAGLVVLTNALVYRKSSYREGTSLLYSSPVVARELVESGARPSGRIKLDSLLLEHQLQPPAFHLNRPKSEPLVIRSFFPETWLWANASANSQGQTEFEARLPDTIGTWVLSAFSLSERSGLALAHKRPTIRAFRPFFIKLNLPYSIIRGEVVALQAIVFNYAKRATQARVTLENPMGEFEFVEPANSVEEEKGSLEAAASKLVRVPPEDGASVVFLIRPRKLGHLELRVIAQGELAADGVSRRLLVKPEGQTQYLNKAMLIAPGFKRNVSVEVPANAVLGSRKLLVTLAGDLLGPGLLNVDDLLRLPYGCGEQNMINLVPNIVLLAYLKQARRLRETQRARAVRNIETGYQRQLNYKRPDGSFSAFGERDSNGSVWLTAYVLKSLQQARQVGLAVDERVVRRAANFIARHSRPDGSIEEVGMVHDRRLLSIASGHSSYVTAYALIALLQRPIQPDPDAPAPIALDEVLERGLAYLEARLEDSNSQKQTTTSDHELAIIALALHLATAGRSLAHRDSMERAYELLWARAHEEGDLTWWSTLSSANQTDSRDSNREDLEREFSATSVDEMVTTTTTTQQPPLKPTPAMAKQSAHLFLPESLAIETSAMALLVTVGRGELERALPIVRWLISRQNSLGGFVSTQDTVLAIEALAAFAAAAANNAATEKQELNVELVHPPQKRKNATSPDFRRHQNQVEELKVTGQNAQLSQQVRLPDETEWVSVTAGGQGVAVLQVSWQYNLAVSAERPAFYLNPVVDKSSSASYLQLSVCTYYKAGEASNMALLEVELPSGYVADVEALPSLTREPLIKRVETQQGDTRVLVYIDRVTREELCVTVPAHRTSMVSNNRPVPVTIQDYYQRQHTARIFYQAPATSSCDICGDTCGPSCSIKKLLDRPESLHEQRRKKVGELRSQDRFANLTTMDDTNGPPANGANHQLAAYQILPLAPVFVTLVSAVRNITDRLAMNNNSN